MNKKKYEKPMTQVVVLQQQTALLQASKGGYESVQWSPEFSEQMFDEESN